MNHLTFARLVYQAVRTPNNQPGWIKRVVGIKNDEPGAYKFEGPFVQGPSSVALTGKKTMLLLVMTLSPSSVPMYDLITCQIDENEVTVTHTGHCASASPDSLAPTAHQLLTELLGQGERLADRDSALPVTAHDVAAQLLERPDLAEVLEEIKKALESPKGMNNPSDGDLSINWTSGGRI